jgi:hypothetical protein
MVVAVSAEYSFGATVASPPLVVFGFRRRERRRAVSPDVGDEVVRTKGANCVPDGAEAVVQASDSF